MPVPPIQLMENRDEHRGDILEKILRLRAIEERGVLAQLVRDLIDDEMAALRERLIRFREQGALLLDLQNAERDSGKDVVAVRDAPALQLLRQARGISVDDVDAGIVRELAPRSREKAGSSSKRSNWEPAGMRRAISREWTPSPGPYSAITRGWLKSILRDTRFTRAFELGMIEAIWNGRCKNRLKKRALMKVGIVGRWLPLVQSGCKPSRPANSEPK